MELNEVSSDIVEDEYDIAIGEQAYKDYIDNGMKSRPLADLIDELNEIN